MDELIKDIVLHGFTYVCTLGYEPKQKVDSERDLADVPAGFYLLKAFNRDMAEMVKEGATFDELERIIWAMAKKGELEVKK